MKIIKKTFLITILCTTILSLTMNKRKLIRTILPKIMPNQIDAIYYSLDHTKRTKILNQFYIQNKWRALPLNIKNIQLTEQNKVLSFCESKIVSYKVDQKYQIRGRDNLVNYQKNKKVSIRTTLKSSESELYIPYIEAVTPGSINSKFALKISGEKITIGSYTGENLSHFFLQGIQILQGAFCSNDNLLILLTKVYPNTIYMNTYSCGYTPEQMLCIVAFHRAKNKNNSTQLKKLLKTKLFRSLLKEESCVAKEILQRVNNIIKK